MSALLDVLSVDEIIITINRSNNKSIIVEGRGDLVLFRRIEQEFLAHGVSVLPVGGRDKILSIFDRANEIVNRESVIFFVDKDIWVYSEVPASYNSSEYLMTTYGYSIENDLFVDGKFENILMPEELSRFENDLSKFLHWYSLALSRVISNHPSQTIVDHPKSIICDDGIFEAKCILEDGEIHPEDLLSAIAEDYRKLLRGKSLMALILMQLSATDRNPKYSNNALLELGVIADGTATTRVREWVKKKFVAV